MALKITTQIGTDRGITSEAYVRITNYQLSKFGSADFRIEIFQSEADVPSANSITTPGHLVGTSRNMQIGENLFVQLTKQVEEVVTKTRSVNVPTVTQVERAGVDVDGNSTIVLENVTSYVMQEEEYTETITKTVTDLSSAQGVDIFTFGYSHLKAKLSSLFGAENIVDC